MFTCPKAPAIRIYKAPRLHNPLTVKLRWSTWFFIYAFVGYSAACTLVYFHYVQPWIAGDIVTRIGADSDRYWEAAKNPGTESLVSGNFLVPVSIALLFQNGFAVMCFNFLLFFSAINVARSIPDVDPGVFGFLLALNAELLPTLTTLNKEILALFSSVLIAKYLYASKPSRLALFGVLFVSFFARWEEAAILILYLFLRRILPGYSKVSLAVVIAAITVAYPFAFRILGIDPSALDWLMEGASTILVLNKIQNAFGFPLVIVPKILMLMAGPLVSPAFYTANPGFADGFSDPQQEIFGPLGCVAMICLFAYAMWTKRMRLSNPIAMFIAITLVATAAVPFIQSRYLFGAYVMLCIELARPRQLYGEPRGTMQRVLSFIKGKRSDMPTGREGKVELKSQEI